MRSFSIKRILVMLGVTIPLVYLAACLLLFVKQRSFIYFPTAGSNRHAAVFIVSEGETLRILTRPAESSDAIILFGGNADDVSGYLGSFAATVPKHNLFLVNYRGYGGSTGTASEKALFADALAVYDHVRAKYTNVSVVGRSLGTGVAVYLSSVREVKNLVLITPYDSIENVAKRSFPIFPIGLLLEDKFDSASRVPSVSAKTLVLVAEHDEVIPRENSEALIKAFSANQVNTVIVKETTHGSIAYSDEFRKQISQFLGSSHR